MIAAGGDVGAGGDTGSSSAVLLPREYVERLTEAVNAPGRGRLIVLTGPAGCGKSSIAAAAGACGVVFNSSGSSMIIMCVWVSGCVCVCVCVCVCLCVCVCVCMCVC